MRGLPKGWAQVPLGKFAAKTKNVDPFKSPAEVFELYSVPSFSNSSPERMSGSEIKSSKQTVQSGDVLLCKIVPHINRVWTVKKLGQHRQIASGEWIVYRNHGCEPHYLRYCLSEESFREQFLSTVAGVGGSLMRARPSEVAKIEVPIPPLPEQRRIVAMLDNLTGRTAVAREQLERIPRLVERYKGALLTVAFQDGFGIENAASFFVPRPLSAAVISTFYGPRIAREAYVSSGIPTLRTTDIGDWGRLCPQDPPQVNVGQQERSKWAFQDGDLMLTRTGATIGKCAIYEGRFGPALPSAYLIRVRLDMQVVVPRFVLLFLLSPKGQRQLLDGRTAVAQPNINANAIVSVELPLPPIELQKAIVHRIEAAFAWLDRMAAEHANASRLLPKLDQAILAKAFRGELVPQDQKHVTSA